MQHTKVLPNCPDMAGMAEVSAPIEYANHDGQSLTLQLITPWNREKTYPLVLFIQGSGWTTPNPGLNLPHLCDIAREGFVVATVVHRSSNDGHPFPAFLVDVKSALRFLRANAAEYCIDTARVTAYGTSSGGNTALLLAMTGDDPRYKNAIHPEESDRVDVMVECFGPTDMMEQFQRGKGRVDDAEALAYFTRILGYDYRTPEGTQAAHDMSPLCILEEGMQLPPMLMLHGDGDTVVPFEQSQMLFDKLCGMGYDVDFVRVTDAEHERDFWTPQVRQEIISFIKTHAK